MNNDRRDFLKYSLGIGLGLLLPKISKSAANNNFYEELGIQKVTIYILMILIARWSLYLKIIIDILIRVVIVAELI